MTRIAEKPLVQEASWNLEWLNKKTVRLLSPSPLPEDDDEMEDSEIEKGDSYGLRGAIYPGQASFPTWQSLDRLPQSKVQLPRAITSSWDFK